MLLLYILIVIGIIFIVLYFIVSSLEKQLFEEWQLSILSFEERCWYDWKLLVVF